MIDRADDALYLFDPETLAFDLLGELDCGLFAGSPASMSVTRDGFAYVRYTDNTVYAVDLDTLECTETAYGGGGFGAFGMGFATDSDTTWRDTLYIANDNQLARMDTATWTVSRWAASPVSRSSPEMRTASCGPYFHSRSPLSWSVSTRTPPRSSTPST